MKEFKLIKPTEYDKAIELCLDLYDKEEAKKRICKYIADTIENIESQIAVHNDYMKKIEA